MAIPEHILKNVSWQVDCLNLLDIIIEVCFEFSSLQNSVLNSVMNVESLFGAHIQMWDCSITNVGCAIDADHDVSFCVTIKR